MDYGLRFGHEELGVVSTHFLGKNLRAVLVSFSRFFPRFRSALLNFN